MTPDMHTALWISAVGTAILFGALACVVAFMYLLTAPWFLPKAVSTDAPLEVPVVLEQQNAEEERRRAVAIAVAASWALAGHAHSLEEPPSDWRRVHLARQLQQAPRRSE